MQFLNGSIHRFCWLQSDTSQGSKNDDKGLNQSVFWAEDGSVDPVYNIGPLSTIILCMQCNFEFYYSRHE